MDKDDFVPEIDRLPKNVAKKLRIDLKDILAFNPSNASGRYAFDMQLFADRIILKKLMVSFFLNFLLCFSICCCPGPNGLCPGSQRQGKELSTAAS